jgi:hypothetical protein
VSRKVRLPGMRLLSAHSLATKAAGASDAPRTTKPTSELAISVDSLTSSLQAFLLPPSYIAAMVCP